MILVIITIIIMIIITEGGRGVERIAIGGCGEAALSSPGALNATKAYINT